MNPVRRGPKLTINYYEVDADGTLVTLKGKTDAAKQKEIARIYARVHTWGRTHGVPLKCQTMEDKGVKVAVLVYRADK